ncbi:MAG: hypothetical protein EA377_05865 [Phycisphaerales bacterium]|nr:MAG: hypothetical protein EA377_05865 [Phycisphaerales bacterium]
MTFITPALFIAGAIAVAVPILIHLLSKQRRRPIEFGAMRFLFEAFRKHKRRLQLEQLLLLLVRCLIVFLLGAALARPVLEQTGLLDLGSSRTVYFIIDDGLISGVEDADGRTALDLHTERALAVMSELDSQDRIGLITTAQPARDRLIPPSSDRRAVRQLIEDLTPRDAPSDMIGAFDRLRRTLEQTDTPNAQVMVYLFSEFRAGSAALDASLPSGLRPLVEDITLLATPPAETAVANVQITSIEPVRRVLLPDGAGGADAGTQVIVRLRRTAGAMEREITRVQLEGTGIRPPEPRTVNWEPGQAEVSVDFRIAAGAQRDREIVLTARIDDDALPADNRRRQMLLRRDQLRVVLLDRRTFGFEGTIDRFRAGQWFRRALEPMDGGAIQAIEVESGAVTRSDLRTADIVITPRPDLVTSEGWNLLRTFVEDGGLLIISPPGELTVHPWTERMLETLNLPVRLALEVEENPDGWLMNESQPTTGLLRLIANDLEELVRPIISVRRLPIELETGDATAVLEFEDGSPFLVSAVPRSPSQRDDANAAANENDDARRESDDLNAGLVVLFSVAPELNWTTLPGKPLMVPMVQEIVRQGFGAAEDSGQLLAGSRPVLPGSRSAIELVGPDDLRVAVDDRGRPAVPFDHAGVYTARDASGQDLRRFVVNIVPDAGRTDPQASSAVRAWLETTGAWSWLDQDDPAAALRATTGASPLALWLLVALVLLVVLETILARYFSHAMRLNERATGLSGTGRHGLSPTLRDSAADDDERTDATQPRPAMAGGGARS